MDTDNININTLHLDKCPSCESTTRMYHNLVGPANEKKICQHEWHYVDCTDNQPTSLDDGIGEPNLIDGATGDRSWGASELINRLQTRCNLYRTHMDQMVRDEIGRAVGRVRLRAIVLGWISAIGTLVILSKILHK